MKEKKISKDGAFAVLFSGSKDNWKDIKVFLGKRYIDGLYELLGGDFDISDITPQNAVCREIKEETSGGIKLDPDSMEYFCHMVQKLPIYGNEKGHAFYFVKEMGNDINTDLCIPSEEHTDLEWHSLESIFLIGEEKYKTATLRILLYFLQYLKEKKFHFGILGEETRFYGFSF